MFFLHENIFLFPENNQAVSVIVVNPVDDYVVLAAKHLEVGGVEVKAEMLAQRIIANCTVAKEYTNYILGIQQGQTTCTLNLRLWKMKWRRANKGFVISSYIIAIHTLFYY